MPIFTQGVVAHRGASAYAPENTMVAFNKAHQLGIQWVEFDVMLTDDNVPVIFHDDTLDRTTNGSGFIDEIDFARLIKLDAGSWFGSQFKDTRVPSLKEAVQFLTKHAMFANIEIKVLHDNDEKLVKQTLDVISQVTLPENAFFLFSSFSITALEVMHHYAPHCKLALLMHEWLEDWQEMADKFACISIHVNQAVLTKERAQSIKASGRCLLSYTVNDIDRANELRGWGVDAVFSDAPDRTRVFRGSEECKTPGFRR